MGRAFLALGAALTLLVGCRSPTEITVSLSTDIACKDFVGDNLYAGDPLTDDAGSITQQQGCPGASGGSLGTFVLAPKGDDSESVSVLVVGLEKGTPGMTPDGCVTLLNENKLTGSPCVVARRTLSFVPHTPLTLPVVLYGACVGKPCSPTETCGASGKCQSSTTTCDGGVCAPGGPPVTDGGHAPDAPLDAALEASRDAAPDATPSVLLYGGEIDPTLNYPSDPGLSDTWVWDGNTWTQIITPSASGPSARFWSSMSTLGTQTLLFGGLSNGRYSIDAWVWNGTGWQRENGAAPPARTSSAMATLGNQIVLFGGIAAAPLGDTWIWNGVKWSTQCAVCGPTPRFSDGLSLQGTGLVLFGGAKAVSTAVGTDLSDTWLFDGASWKQVASGGAVTPPARDGYAMATLGNDVVMFGGEVAKGAGFTPLNDTWVWDGSSWRSPSVPKPPPARVYGAMATLGNRIVLFGGVTAAGTSWVPLGDTWSWDGTAWTESTVKGPTARWGHAMATR